MSFPFAETVTIHHRAGVTQDGDGNDVPTYTDETATAAIYPRGSSVELFGGRDTVTTGLTLVFVPPTTVAAVDQVTARGALWDVDGEQGFLHSPFTATEVSEINLKRATG